jgi:HAD superfamily hydrolase (TIGR01509 family)
MSVRHIRSCYSYSAWLVDLDGTLYHAAPVRLLMAFELLLFGRKWVRVIRTFRSVHEELRRADGSSSTDPLKHKSSDTQGGTHTTCDDPYARQITICAARLAMDEEILREAITEWMHIRPGKWLRVFRRRSLIKHIRTFRQKGGRTALVSDYPAQAKLAALGVTSLFDAIVASGEDGGPRRLKPAPDGYLLAAQRLAVPAERCLVIGDRHDADGEAARRAGMHFLKA